MAYVTFYNKNPNAPKPNMPAHLGSNCIIIYDGKLLLEKRIDSDTWGLVGGGCKKWEEPAQSMSREVYEELGWRVKPADFKKIRVYGNPDRIAAFRDGSTWRMVIVVFLLEIDQDRPIRISSESKEARYFTKDELRQIEIAVTHRDIIEECFLNLPSL